MTNEIIQVEYDTIEEVSKRFAQESERSEQMLQQIMGSFDQLEGGGWQGSGAEAFFAEMHDDVFPALERLFSAFDFAGQGTKQIADVMFSAEQSAANQFQIETSSNQGGIPGAGMLQQAWNNFFNREPHEGGVLNRLTKPFPMTDIPGGISIPAAFVGARTLFPEGMPLRINPATSPFIKTPIGPLTSYTGLGQIALKGVGAGLVGQAVGSVAGAAATYHDGSYGFIGSENYGTLVGATTAGLTTGLMMGGPVGGVIGAGAGLGLATAGVYGKDIVQWTGTHLQNMPQPPPVRQRPVLLH